MHDDSVSLRPAPAELEITTGTSTTPRGDAAGEIVGWLESAGCR